MRRAVLLIACLAVAFGSYREHLGQFLHDFEELAKEKVYLEHVTNFTVLSAMKFYMRIDLQDKTFHAALQPHVTLFHQDIVVNITHSEGSYSKSINFHEYLEGELIDEPGSQVLLHIKDNVATGTIQTAGREKYFIEPSHRHIKEPHDFHMIAYKLSDVKFNLTKPGDEGHFCGHESHQGQTGFTKEDFDFMVPQQPINVIGDDGMIYSRKKRASEDRQNRCTLALIGDHKFYNEVNGGNEDNAINYMLSLIQQIDPLYRKQSMDPEGSKAYENYGFSVKYVEVIKSPEAADVNNYRYYKDGHKRGVSDLLKNFAYGEWRPDYCLAHLFTNYDFDGGVLGLAYVASASKSRVGGVCTRTYTDSTRQTKSLNVGLTTSTNYGRTLLTTELVFVTGHEFGHNWGSSHDSDISKECAPRGNRFMMYPAAVDGSQDNNYLFSPCSRQAIYDVLNSKSEDCFAKENEAVCGNGVVEANEECDPGLTQSDCCADCKFNRQANAQCEPLNDICCGTEGGSKCRFESGKMCLETNGGTADSPYCHGDYTCVRNTTSQTTRYDCVPPDLPVADGKPCYGNGQCRDGECTDYCAYNGKIRCLCPKPEDPEDPEDPKEPDNQCKECCKDTPEGECATYNADGGDPDNLPNGRMCENGDGKCNVGTCEIGPQDIQEKFWDVIDRLDVNMVMLWFKNNIVFAIIVFTSIFWIPISFFINWLDNNYDLGVLDDLLGSSSAEQKKDDEKRLIQEMSSV